MKNRINQLLNAELITPAEAIDVEFAVLVGDVSEAAALRTLDRVELNRMELWNRKPQCGVVAILGERARGSGRVIRTLSI